MDADDSLDALGLAGLSLALVSGLFAGVLLDVPGGFLVLIASGS